MCAATYTKEKDLQFTVEDKLISVLVTNLEIDGPRYGDDFIVTNFSQRMYPLEEIIREEWFIQALKERGFTRKRTNK